MRKSRPHRIFLSWVSYNLLLPLIPLVFGVSVAYLRANNLSIPNLFGGTELFFFAMTVLASTKSDLDNSRIDISTSIIYSLFSSILPLLALFTACVFAIVYIDQNVVKIGLNRELTANTAIFAAIFSSLTCVPLQIFIAVVNNRSEQ